ncbi:MAG TPA: protein jag [Clostridiales bacterium]|nr:protein jag [Clostridiales bacterium]
MEEWVEKTGKTVDEAISIALEELEGPREYADIEVLEEGNKGLLGMFGKHEARIRARIKLDTVGKVCAFLDRIFENMGADITAMPGESSDALVLRLEGPDVGIAIGRRGEVLDALQYLASLVFNKDKHKYKRLILDSEDYRSKREETLERLAERLAEKARRNRRNVVLEPMNPYERRIIHAALQNHRYVKTYSIGEEPNRKVVIACK